MPTKQEKDAFTGRETTGHEWDGIRELDTPLPLWWLYCFYATIVFTIGYCVLYPAIPFLQSHSEGLLGYTQRAALTEEIAAATSAQSGIRQKIRDTALLDIRKDADLLAFAQIGGRAAFSDNCAPCHRAGGAGTKGFPNLADDDWLWGGSLTAIQQTIAHGIRNSDPDSRQNPMPAFGADGILTPAQIGDVVDFVLSLSQKATASNPAIERGRKVFAENCVACHGPSGAGNQELGAKNLANGIWLYGGDKPSLVETVGQGRSGSMPAWDERLDAETIKMLTIYVHSLGGGL